MTILRFLLGSTLLALSLSAAAQIRAFPDNAPRGYLSPIPGKGDRVLVNDKQVVLSAGAQIRDQSNIIIIPAMIKPDSIVKYQFEGNYLHRAWILTPYEISLPDKHKLPTRVLPATD